MASGMPYTAVTYGMAIEDKIANYPEKLYRDFWANKIDVSYNEFPFERVRQTKLVQGFPTYSTLTTSGTPDNFWWPTTAWESMQSCM